MPSIKLPLDSIAVDPVQIRSAIDDSGLDELAASINASRLLQPLGVRSLGNDRYALVFGHRRLAALRRNGATHAECLVVEACADEATTLREQFAENHHRSDISAIDEAKAYRRYMELRSIPAVLAAKELSVSPARVSKLLSLLDLPDEFQKKIHDGSIPAEIGYHISRIQVGPERERLLDQAAAGTLRRDAAIQAAKAQRPTKADEKTVARATCLLTGGRSITVSAPALRLDVLIESLEEILKEARKARTQGWDVSTLARVCRDRAEGTP